MGEGFVTFGHLVDVLALLDGFTFVLSGEHEFLSQLLTHWFTFLALCSLDDPLHSQELLTLLAHLTRHLIVGTTNATRTHLHKRTGITHSLLENGKRLLFRLFFNNIKSIIDHGLGHCLLATLHETIDKLAHHWRFVLVIRSYLIPIFYFASHYFLGSLAPYLLRPRRRDSTPVASRRPRTM